MNRRQVLALAAVGFAGCSESADDSTPTSTPTATGTPTPTETDVTTETQTPTPTATPSSEEPIEAAVTALNGAYGTFAESLGTADGRELDTAGILERIRSARSTLQAVEPTDAAERERIDSLLSTALIFDWVVVSFDRVSTLYGLHEELHAHYVDGTYTADAESTSTTFQDVANRVGAAVAIAVSRYRSMRSFDDALDVEYGDFGPTLLRYNDAAATFPLFGLGLRDAIRGVERWNRGIEQYETGAYRDAENAFGDVTVRFTSARDRFEEIQPSLFGPLRSFNAAYICRTRNGRLAAVDFRAACREQQDGDAAAADRRRAQAESRYGEC